MRVNHIVEFYRKAWNAGDFDVFVNFSEQSKDYNENNLDLSRMLAGAALFLDNKSQAEALLNKAISLSNRAEVKRFSLSAYQTQLGRAAILADKHQQAFLYFQSALAMGGELIQPFFYDFVTQEAEHQLQQGETRVAIQTWQDLASILQEDTPESVYHRMSYCYAVNQQGFGGTQEENQVWGDCHKHDLLEFFHTNLQPDFYFEIGVDEGLSLARAKGKAVGVDARPKLNLKIELSDQVQILGVSSDAFFRDQAAQILTAPPDLAFIDGMHLFEFALRDFINLERYAAPYALVGIDDIYPCHPTQAERRRRSSAWTGDIWKLLPILKKYRPDLTLLSLPCSTTGLLLIAGLDRYNTQLVDHYDEILKEYQADLPVPEPILQRSESVPSDHPVVSLLLSLLKQAKKEQTDIEQVRECLTQIMPLIEQAKLDQGLPLHPKTLKQLAQEKALAEAQTYQAQLFLPQTKDSVYSESKSQIKTLPSSGWQRAVFCFQQGLEHYQLRLDPSNRSGLFEINKIILIDKNSGKVFLNLTEREQLRKLEICGDCLILWHPDKFLFFAYSADPIIYLPLVQVFETELELHIGIRQISDTTDLREYWRKHLENLQR